MAMRFSFHPGDKLLWNSQPATFVQLVKVPNADEEPLLLTDCYVAAAWIRLSDGTLTPVPLDQLRPSE